MILHLHLVVCIYIGSYLEYNNCGLYAMSTIAYKRPVLLLMTKVSILPNVNDDYPDTLTCSFLSTLPTSSDVMTLSLKSAPCWEC